MTMMFTFNFSESSSLRLHVQIPRVATLLLAGSSFVFNEGLRIVPTKVAKLKINNVLQRFV